MNSNFSYKISFFFFNNTATTEIYTLSLHDALPIFKELQQQWKEIKAVPADKANELWRNYQLYVEQFYDLLKLNSEAREYDFKKNLELKTALCEAAEKLDQEEDVISAFHQLRSEEHTSELQSR